MKSRSIYTRFVFAVLAALVPLTVLVNLGNLYFLQQIRTQAAQTGADLVQLYRAEADKSIGEIEDYLFLFRSSETSFVQLQSEDAQQRLYAAVDLHQKLALSAASFRLVDSFFVYAPQSDCYLCEYGSSSSYAARADQKAYLFAGGFSAMAASDWQAVTVNGHSYLLWQYYSKGIYLGAWVDVAALEAPLASLGQADGAVCVITDAAGNPTAHADLLQQKGITLGSCDGGYYFSGRGQRYIVNGLRSTVGDFCLFLLFPEKAFTEQFTALQKAILAISLLALLLVPLLVLRIDRDILRPLKALDKGIRAVNSGDLRYQIPPGNGPAEFERINQAFNGMTSQLRALRIRSYEDVIEKQKLRLSYLQMQIRPHFFLNALTTVSNFARLGQQELLDRFIRYLAEYLRYMFRSNLTLVPLRDEVSHIETYLAMQEARFSGTLSHVFDVSEAAQAVPIPPFTLHNFAENVIKHAMADRDRVTLYLQAQVEDGLLTLVLEDNGAGLTEDALAQLNDPDYAPQEGRSIGIWNVRQTLAILYGGQAQVSLSPSLLGGARVQIVLPCRPPEKGAQHEDPAV